MQAQIGVYKTVEKIGEGGMGEVYRGLDTLLEREVAIKQLRAEYAGHSETVERFRTEAVTLAKLNHSNIVTLYSFVREENALYMVLEFVRGETLDAMIRRRGALPWPEAVALVIQALRGLGHAHRMHVIHRDLKPANAIVTSSGVLKLMDFGIARILNTARMTRVGHMIGTLQYMAPEQVKGGEGDARSDLYSLGIVLYELLAGRVPFDATTDYELIKAQVEAVAPPLETFGITIPAGLMQVLERALEKAPEKRFQSAAEFAQALQAVLDPTNDAVQPNYQTSGAGLEKSPRGRNPFLESIYSRISGQLLSLAMPARKLSRATVAFTKESPIVAAAAIMVLVGLGLVFAARTDRNTPVISDTATRGKGSGREADIATPRGSLDTVDSTEPATAPDGSLGKIPTTPSTTAGGEGAEPAPLKKPTARPPRERVPGPVATQPEVPLQITEKQAVPSSPASPPPPAREENSWQNTPVRR